MTISTYRSIHYSINVACLLFDRNIFGRICGANGQYDNLNEEEEEEIDDPNQNPLPSTSQSATSSITR